MAISDTYPTTTAASRGKMLYRYNIREIQASDPAGKTHTAYEYDEVWIEGAVTKAKVLAALGKAEREADTGSITGVATQYADAKAAQKLSGLATMSYAQLDAYIEANVTTLAAARAYLKKLSAVVLAMLKERE